MDIVEKYELFSRIGNISAIVFLLISVILFFALKVTKVFGYLTGITRRKAISEIRKKNENDENDFITAKINGVRNKRRDNVKIGNVDITSKIVKAEFSSMNYGDADENETILLTQNRNENKEFTIIKDITFIHTNVSI